MGDDFMSQMALFEAEIGGLEETTPAQAPLAPPPGPPPAPGPTP
eukprot:CAMPEP_0198200682 /NCGR_PEP_ID=MMETSP1445-20131203/3651_1 /TAXON_ID=36898 /ORGANISM="Pyramimonas sp., Strain CCMP2087" /LENGTH=43 /DNA_ID= /DNA_START= /DNA_END= /DNA_ORIENTATION=